MLPEEDSARQGCIQLYAKQQKKKRSRRKPFSRWQPKPTINGQRPLLGNHQSLFALVPVARAKLITLQRVQYAQDFLWVAAH